MSDQEAWRTSVIVIKRFSKAVEHNYDATTEVVQQGAGTQRFIVFPDVLQTDNKDPKSCTNKKKTEATIECHPLDHFICAGSEGSRSLSLRYYIKRVEGQMTMWDDFKKAFEAFMMYNYRCSAYKLTTEETRKFALHGYAVSRDHICSACHEPSRVGCCANYSKANRTKRWRIWNMELVREDVEAN